MDATLSQWLGRRVSLLDRAPEHASLDSFTVLEPALLAVGDAVTLLDGRAPSAVDRVPHPPR